MVAEEELGVTPPLGFFDPLGFMESQPQNFERRRAVERKHGRRRHGRCCWHARAQRGPRVPRLPSSPPARRSARPGITFASIPDGYAGLFSLPPSASCRSCSSAASWRPPSGRASDYSGNYGTGYPFGDLSDPEVRAFKLNLELNQGRAAMLGIFAANLQEGIQGQTLAEHIASGGKILVPGLF